MARTRQVADHTAHSNEIHPRTQVDEEIPSGSWTPPLNWELCATSTGDIITPFAHHVRIGPTTHTNATFPQFQNLPAELQLQILSNCDRVTVWSIMRASPNLRKEARAAFWSDSNIWYPVDGFWLWNGGFAGDTDHDMHFLKLVQQVEITFHRIKDVWDRESLQDRQPELMDEFLETFWRIFKELYPNAVKVVISE